MTYCWLAMHPATVMCWEYLSQYFQITVFIIIRTFCIRSQSTRDGSLSNKLIDGTACKNIRSVLWREEYDRMGA